MDDPFAVPLEDDDLLAEVELTVDLIIVASAAPGRLPQEEIDRILDVRPAYDDGDRASA